MIKTIYQLFGLKLLEITRYEDEKEMLIINEQGGEGVVIEVSASELKKIQDDNKTL